MAIPLLAGGDSGRPDVLVRALIMGAAWTLSPIVAEMMIRGLPTHAGARVTPDSRLVHTVTAIVVRQVRDAFQLRR